MAKIDFKVSQKHLNAILANHMVLYVQTLNYHWNLVGPEFHDYHLLFDKQYNTIFSQIDLIAERVRAVEGVAIGSMQEALKLATLKEDTAKTPKPTIMVKKLLDQYETLIEQIRGTLETLETKTKDFGTKKMLEDMIELHEKTAWMLRSLTGK